MKKKLLALTPLFMALAFSVDAYSVDVDRTLLVGTYEYNWERYDGASGALCDAKYAPMVTTSDGRTVQLVEDFQWGYNHSGAVLSQKVRGLENGNYTVVLYANAVTTHERDNFDGTPASSGATDVAYVFAGDKKVPVPVKVATSIDVNGEYTIANVEVTDGTLLLGISTYKTGTNWHTIQIKSLIQHDPAQTFYEWRGGKYTERSVSEIDSITFSLPETNPVQVQAKVVDLGLPSGTLWADRNIGADSPEDIGDYFAWGETAAKSTYSWNTYNWCDGPDNTITKYGTDYYDSDNIVDNKTILEAADDAATANWGNQWRMPTYDEFSELIDKCTWTWIKNGVKGYKVTGPNGNSIFFPAAGYVGDGGLNDTVYYGRYWSSSLYQDYSEWALFLTFYLSYRQMDCDYRYYGYTVRAVVK